MIVLKSSKLLRTFFFLLKSFLGIGCLTFPYAFSIIGVTPAVLLTILVVILIRYSMIQLIYVDDLLLRKSGCGGSSFPQIALHSFQGINGFIGIALEYLTLSILIFGQIGTCVSYLMFLSTNIRALLLSNLIQLSHTFSIILFIPLLIPLVLVRDVKTLHPSAVAGMMAFAIGISCLILQCKQSNEIIDTTTIESVFNIYLYKPDGLFRFIGIALFAAEGITAIPSAKTSLEEDEEDEYEETVLETIGKEKEISIQEQTGDFINVLNASLLTMTFILLLFGAFGWYCLGINPPSIVTEALSFSLLSLSSRLFLVVYIFFTLPLQLYPVSQALEALFFQISSGKTRERRNSGESVEIVSSSFITIESNSNSTIGGSMSPRKLSPIRSVSSITTVPSNDQSNLPWYHSLRIGLLVLTAIIATNVSSFAGILSVIGWLSFGVLTFLLPPLMYVVQVTTHFTSDQLIRGYHLLDWKRRLNKTTSRASDNVSYNAIKNDEQPLILYSWHLERCLLFIYCVGGTVLSIFGCINAIYEVKKDQSNN
jgi:amino acid permease